MPAQGDFDSPPGVPFASESAELPTFCRRDSRVPVRTRQDQAAFRRQRVNVDLNRPPEVPFAGAQLPKSCPEREIRPF